MATHFPPVGSPSQIDIILSNNPHKLLTYSQINSGLSSHDLLFASLDCPVLDSLRSFLRRNLNKIIVDLLIDATYKLWENLNFSNDIDAAVTQFNNIICELLDTLYVLLHFSNANWVYVRNQTAYSHYSHS